MMANSGSSDPASLLAGLTLLRGRNTVLQPDRALAAAVGGKIQPTSAAVHGTTLEITLCRTATDLARTLDWGFGLSGGVGPLSLLQARQAFFESLRTTVFSVSLVVQARRVLHALEVVQPRLLADAAPSLDPGAVDAFVALHGDSFVSSVQLGGDIQGVYTFYAQTQEQAQQVEQAFGASLAFGALTLGPQLSSKVHDVSSSTGVNTSFRVMVRGLSQLPSLTQDDLVPFASGFGSMPLDRPEVLSLQTTGYELVPALHEAFSPVATNRDLFTGDAASEGLLRQRLRLRELANQHDWIRGTYAVYGLVPDASLEDNRVRIRTDVASIDTLRQQYGSSPSTPIAAPTLTAFQTGSPRLNVRVTNGERMGGEGGEPFALTRRQQAVVRRRRLVRVGIRAQARVDQIRLVYREDSETTAGEQEWEEVHGGNGGSDRGILELGDGVSISRIEAKTGRRVDCLRITSSDGQSISGGGDAGNRPLNWSPPAQSVVLGFNGRSKAELDALVPVVAEFGPMRWEPVEQDEDP